MDTVDFGKSQPARYEGLKRIGLAPDVLDRTAAVHDPAVDQLVAQGSATQSRPMRSTPDASRRGGV